MALFDRLSLAQRSILPSLAGFLFYGSWAFSVNVMHGLPAAIKAAIVQGTYSFFITLCMTLLIEVLFRFLRGILPSVWLASVLTVLFSCTPVFIGSWLVNAAAGTPEIFKTVILGYVIGFFFSTTYVIGLHKKRSA